MAIYSHELDDARPRRPQLLPLASSAAEDAPSALDLSLIAIVSEPPATGETIELSFRSKEVAIGELFAKLTVSESRALHARLANPREGDALAAKFGCLNAARRGRLLAFLADVRRRHAMGR